MLEIVGIPSSEELFCWSSTFAAFSLVVSCRIRRQWCTGQSRAKGGGYPRQLGGLPWKRWSLDTLSWSLNQMQICIDSTCTKSQAFNYVGVYIKDLSTTAPIWTNEWSCFFSQDHPHPKPPLTGTEKLVWLDFPCIFFAEHTSFHMKWPFHVPRGHGKPADDAGQRKPAAGRLRKGPRRGLAWQDAVDRWTPVDQLGLSTYVDLCRRTQQSCRKQTQRLPRYGVWMVLDGAGCQTARIWYIYIYIYLWSFIYI